MKNGKVYLSDCIRWSIKRNPKQWPYWVGVYIAIRLDSVGKKEMVSLKDMKLLNAWKRLWGAGE